MNQSAAARYGQSARTATAPRELEAAAFIFVNRLMTEATDGVARIKALNRNHKLWSLLLTDIGLTSNTLPPVLKSDLVKLARWAMAYSTVAIARDLPLRPLLDINGDMIDALRSGGTAPAPAAFASRPTAPASPARGQPLTLAL
jgi:flagellar protein FlaF